MKEDGSTQLGKLVRQQNLNFVTLNIHSETQFSLQLPNRPEVSFPLTPESTNHFLNAMGSNKIPDTLYEYILTCNMAEQMFYSGCLIVYVQNFTRTLSSSSKYFTLLAKDYSVSCVSMTPPCMLSSQRFMNELISFKLKKIFGHLSQLVIIISLKRMLNLSCKKP